MPRDGNRQATLVTPETAIDQTLLAGRLARNLAFWERRPTDRPLLGVAVNVTFPALTFGGQPLSEGCLTPDRIEPRQFLAEWDETHRRCDARGEDLLTAASPHPGVPWMEAIAGCQIRVSPASGSIWAEHANPDWDSLGQIRFDPHQPWLLRLLECTRQLRQHAAGRYPVANPILRGISDIAAALLGTQRMVFEFYDHPDRMRDLLARCADIWKGVGARLVEAMGHFEGGMCAGRRRAWTPGSCILYQDDAVSLLSPRLYQDFLVPLEDAILRCFDRTMIHVHSGTLPIMMDGLLALGSLHAVEVLLDPGGKPLSDLLPLFRRIQARKALLICGDMSLADLRLLRQALSPAGLCLLPKVNSEDEADVLFERLLVLWGEDTPTQRAAIGSHG